MDPTLARLMLQRLGDETLAGLEAMHRLIADDCAALPPLPRTPRDATGRSLLQINGQHNARNAQACRRELARRRREGA